MTFINEKGELLTDDLFDEDGDTYFVIYQEIQSYLDELPANSPAVLLYYAEELSAETHGNYSAETLFVRAL